MVVILYLQNPDLKADNCALIHNQAYCVEKNYGNDDETEPQPEVVVQPIVADPPTTLIVLPSPNANNNPIAQPQAQPAQPAQPKAPGPVQPGQIATCNRVSFLSTSKSQIFWEHCM